MDEAKKTKVIRGDAFVKQYLQGKVIDISAGNDLVCEYAERFDLENGDANVITRYRQIKSYDCVHSSHCLEHMHDPVAALKEWWALVKPGGYLVIVVPDEDLYEQGIWPSIFNKDHKATFTLKTHQSWSPVSFNIENLVRDLRDAEILSVALHDAGYNYALHHPLKDVADAKNGRTLRRFIVRLLRSIAKRLPFAGNATGRKVEELGFQVGVPVDQTMRHAVAKIQVVAKNRLASTSGLYTRRSDFFDRKGRARFVAQNLSTAKF